MHFIPTVLYTYLKCFEAWLDIAHRDKDLMNLGRRSNKEMALLFRILNFKLLTTLSRLQIKSRFSSPSIRSPLLLLLLHFFPSVRYLSREIIIEDSIKREISDISKGERISYYGNVIKCNKIWKEEEEEEEEGEKNFLLELDVIIKKRDIFLPSLKRIIYIFDLAYFVYYLLMNLSKFFCLLSIEFVEKNIIITKFFHPQRLTN